MAHRQLHAQREASAQRARPLKAGGPDTTMRTLSLSSQPAERLTSGGHPLAVELPVSPEAN
jgi:hypothetical protein